MVLKPIALGLLTLSAGFTGAALAHDHSQQSFSWQSWLASCESDSGCDQIEDTVEQHGWQLTPQQWQGLLGQCEQNWTCDQAEDWLTRDNDHDTPPPAAAPEIDPAGAMGALTLLAGGLAALRGRRSGKKTT